MTEIPKPLYLKKLSGLQKSDTCLVNLRYLHNVIEIHFRDTDSTLPGIFSLLNTSKCLKSETMLCYLKTLLCCFQIEVNYLHNAYLSGVLIPSPSMIHFQH